MRHAIVWTLFVVFGTVLAGCAHGGAETSHADTATLSGEESRPAEALKAEPEKAAPARPVDGTVGYAADELGTYAEAKRDKTTGAEPPAPPRSAPPGGRPASPGVKAGAADDNMQFGAFLKFLAENINLGLRADVSDRLIVSVRDRKGLPLADARVVARVGDRIVAERRTYADGRTLIFPSEFPALRTPEASFEVSFGERSTRVRGLQGNHRLEVTLDLERPAFAEVPLDIAFILDTTGSMDDEIAQLKATLDVIHFQVSNLSPRPAVRFGMVLFRDRGDDYLTRVVPFTENLEEFRRQLSQVAAGGGGDTPEDVQAALQAALRELPWRTQGVKLAFLIGDAPPHLDYGQAYSYISAMQDAASRGIKIAAIGASGLDRQGELVWRQVAQYTLAPFVFLTYGERGDSEGGGGALGGVSHHVGSNWVAENLDAIVIRLVKTELSHYSPTGVAPSEDYFAASTVSGMANDSVLEDLFSQAARQLTDYCVQRLDARTPTLVLPFKAEAALKATSERLWRHLSLALSRRGEFALVESQEQEKLLSLMGEQFKARYDGAKVAELGKLVPAKLMVFSELSRVAPGKLELLVRLVRLETGEILSLSLLKIEEGLLVAWASSR